MSADDQNYRDKLLHFISFQLARRRPAYIYDADFFYRASISCAMRDNRHVVSVGPPVGHVVV